MPDLLVNLLTLSPLERSIPGVVIRRAQPFEITPVRHFIQQNFSTGWADEVSVGFANKPVSVLLATVDGQLVGFAAYECTRRAFFGPMGVLDQVKGRGIGRSLLLACMEGLKELGYVYGIIGAAGPVEFYQKTVGAVVIENSEPGIYRDFLKTSRDK
ncbi:MAG TPA: GNAT family N-acetyltransferase [Pyrinomonadaceae bacterium]|nr:GNAT family N-acetyltransferase [Pyrinomonadaceae bacterium]